MIFISAGRGYAPGEIRKAGEDVTALFLKGAPGYAKGILAQRPSTSDANTLPAWMPKVLIGVAIAVAAAGISKPLGWT